MANVPLPPVANGWVVYNPDNKPVSPVEDDIRGEEGRNRGKILDALGSLSRDLVTMGFSEVVSSGKLKRAKLGPATVPRLYFSVTRSADRNPYAIYVTIKDGVPALLHVGRIDGQASTVEKMSATAASRLALYEEHQHSRALESDVPKVPRRVAAVFVEPQLEVRPKQTHGAPIGSPPVLHLDEAAVRPLITAKHDVASLYERLVSDRHHHRRQIAEGLDEEFDTKVADLDAAVRQVKQTRADIKVQQEAERSAQQSTADGEPVQSRLRRVRGWFKANKQQESLTRTLEDSPEVEALQGTLAALMEREEKASSDLRNVQAARSQLQAIDITELTVIDRLDDDGAADTVASLLVAIEDVRSRGVRLGHQLLTDDRYDIPVILEVLGRQLPGQPDDPSTWGNGRNSARSETQALLAADIAAFHTEHGLSFDQPAYGFANSYRDDAPRSVYLHRTEALMAFQKEARSQGIVPGTGIDSARRPGQEQSAVTRAIENATLGHVAPASRIAAQDAVSL